MYSEHFYFVKRCNIMSEVCELAVQTLLLFFRLLRSDFSSTKGRFLNLALVAALVKL